MSETKNEGIGGKVKPINDFNQLVVGLAEVEVILINPNREEYKEVLGMDLKEDSKADEYLGESKEGNTTLRVDVWVKNVKTNRKDKITYFLENKEKVNKDGSKKQYINNIGSCSWASEPENLSEWFVKRDYRVAYNGEEEFYKFMKTWLGKLDYKDDDATLQIKWKDILKGNLSLAKSQIGGVYATTFVAPFAVKTVKKDDGSFKEYQTIYNKELLPTFALKYFRNVDYDKQEVIDGLKAKKKPEIHEKFVINIKGEYGCRDSFVLKDLKLYNPADFIVGSDEPIEQEGPKY